MPSRVPQFRLAGPREGVWLSHITRKDKSPGESEDFLGLLSFCFYIVSLFRRDSDAMGISADCRFF